MARIKSLYLPRRPSFLTSSEKVISSSSSEVPWSQSCILTASTKREAIVYVKRGANRIGRIYKKAIYKQFTDETYSQEITKPSWLGFLGPVLIAEENDTFIVHLKNFASRPYSLHPHGVFYKKDSEGALYPDGTGGKSKADDFVLPGTNYTYTWPVTYEFAPTSTDPRCLTWIYHSHIDTPKDISTGVIGPLLVCKKGTLDDTLVSTTDVTKNFALMFSIIDENLSWYLDENINTFCLEPSTVDKEDEDFQSSNKMHAINGYVFGNLPGLEMCAGELVSWQLFGMGTMIDIHSAQFFGHTLLNRGYRMDVISLFPATFITAEMMAENAGKWLLACQVDHHMQAGMTGLYNIKVCGQNITEPSRSGQERRYFIAAERILWDYGPGGIDKFTGQALNATGSDSAPFFTQGDDRIGGRYWKAHYVSYTDGTFTQRKKQPVDDTHLGILGPVIKAEVEDTILVTFANKADKNYSIMPHGVAFDKSSEGAPYADGHQKLGACVKPGETFQYKWRVPESVSPTDDDPPCLTYLYYSATDPMIDSQSGLVGPLIICKKNTLKPDGTQKGVDREFYLLFTVFDENLSFYLDINIDAFTGEPSKVNKEDEDFQESNKMHAVNGYVFGNLPGLTMCKDDNVSWHMIGLGTSADMHGVHFQGNTIHLGGTTRDTLALFPHTSKTVLMQPDRVGTFHVVCRTFDHFTGGMKQLYKVKPCGKMSHNGTRYGTMRTYYIAAEEMEWDYAPDKSRAEKKGEAMNKSCGHVFVSQGEDRIGSKYKKVVYREFKSGDFTEYKTRTAKEHHLQILGPLIHAEVGNSILIVFKNKASRPYSVSAHGVEEEAGSKVHITMPGEISTYRWNVPERSGPGASDPNCITWVYYSTAHFVKDMYSGLIGPLIICRKGVLNEKGLRTDIDREFAVLFLVFDENESWYLNENIEKYLHKNPKEFSHTSDFVKGNYMHAINGKIYNNLHGLTMNEGENTNWYLIGMGNEIDIHTVHFHGESFLFKMDHEHRGDVYDLFPATFQTVELVAFNPGTWLLHCHVHCHIHNGMETTYTIVKSDDVGHVATTTGYDTFTVNRTETGKGNGRAGIEFFGKTLGLGATSSVLKALFLTGLVVLVAILILMHIVACQKKRACYSVGHAYVALPSAQNKTRIRLARKQTNQGSRKI
ncbi:ferroxidase HEPHL1 isoform X2 [Rhineura floridana]|uniref:ferroxidase HEPHL1 isoform X2 n=1 Tax=Rhineura floridana TaxID=261503 RepID=UPI002AC85604|nr:ferroxidase HEPHL1 isoform X2 [Rhineura floridana]